MNALKKKIDRSIIGPDLNKKLCPTFLYFALSAEESLHLSPINQPAQILAQENIRVISYSIPFHDKQFSAKESMKKLKKALLEESTFFIEFLDVIEEDIKQLIKIQTIDPSRLAAGGVSRGGFIALQLAARMSDIATILCFSPVTHLNVLKEFKGLSSPPQHLTPFNKENTLSKLTNRALRFYVGNNDRCVDTDEIYQFFKELTQINLNQGIRTPKTELRLFPSIGYQGHGTPDAIFSEGANYIKSKLLSPLN